METRRLLRRAGSRVGHEACRETFLSELKQRMRDIRQGPDGLISFLTEEEDGVVLKVEPAS